MRSLPIRAAVMPFAVEGDEMFYFSMEFLPNPDAEKIRESLQKLREQGILANPPPPKVTYFLTRSRIDGSGAVSLFESTSPDMFLLGRESIFFTEAHLGRVLKAPRAGGEPAVIAEGLAFPRTIRGDENALYVACLGGTWGPEKIVRIEGSKVTTLKNARSQWLVEDGEWLVWADETEIRRVEKTGGREGLVTRVEKRIFALTAFEGTAYFSTHDGIFRCAVSGGIAARISTDVSQNIAVDESGVYWTRTASAGGRVGYRLASGETGLLPQENQREWREITVGAKHVFVTGNPGMHVCEKPI